MATIIFGSLVVSLIDALREDERSVAPDDDAPWWGISSYTRVTTTISDGFTIVLVFLLSLSYKTHALQTPETKPLVLRGRQQQDDGAPALPPQQKQSF